jgi:hypothetical protein
MRTITEKLSRRDFLRLSALTAAGMALSACGPTPTEEPAEPVEEQPAEPVEQPPAEEGVTIQYWAAWVNTCDAGRESRR